MLKLSIEMCRLAKTMVMRLSCSFPGQMTHLLQMLRL